MWPDGLLAAAEGAAALERYRGYAAALGLRERADALLAQVQGQSAGSMPTADHLDAAGFLLDAEALGLAEPARQLCLLR
nr:hypothetical protein KPHV_29940 [Kitasatospora purpeofusca]